MEGAAKFIRRIEPVVSQEENNNYENDDKRYIRTRNPN